MGVRTHKNIIRKLNIITIRLMSLIEVALVALLLKPAIIGFYEFSIMISLEEKKQAIEHLFVLVFMMSMFAITLFSTGIFLLKWRFNLNKLLLSIFITIYYSFAIIGDYYWTFSVFLIVLFIFLINKLIQYVFRGKWEKEQFSKGVEG